MIEKKVLVLSDSFSGYGAEHILRWLGNKLVSSGYSVIFCSIFDNEKSPELASEAKYYQMGFPYRVFDRNYFFKGRKIIAQLYKNYQFTHVITFHTNPFLMALMARLTCGFKLVHSERDNPYNRDTAATKFKMWLYRYADQIVFQTEGAQKYFGKKTQRKSIIIPNPVSVTTKIWTGFESRTIVSVGRLFIRFKRQDVLLRAFKNVLFFYPDYILLLFGDGPDMSKLKIMARDMGVEDNVKFMGRMTNIPDRILKEGIFVLSSDSEGMPNSLMEAMALGMPVVSTDCQPGGAKALITNGVDGILVGRSSDDELSAAMLKLIKDKDLQKSLGKNARIKMKQFDQEVVFSKWIQCFK